MDLTTALPLLDGWQYSPLDLDTAFTVDPGDEYNIYTTVAKGWVVSIVISLNNPLGDLVIISHDAYQRPHRADILPYYLQEYRLTSPNPAGVWISTYDTVNNIYIANYAPSPWLPFRKQGKLSVKNGTSLPLTVRGYAHLLVEITDEDKFRKSIKELMS